MQAEKDFTFLVKHDWTTTVRHDRTDLTGHDNARLVIHDQDLVVGHDRDVAVVHDISQQAVTGTATLKSKKMTLVESDESILLCVGNDSYILIEPGKITIQSPRVEINPKGGAGGGGKE
jgi:hypothetical protein